ncbi:MAG: dynamin family protein [Bacteroides sp.]|nr:dynamin family protein [Bacteroides sp.]
MERFDKNEQLKMLAGLEERAKRIEEIADRYDIEEGKRADLLRQLDRIKETEDGEALKMAVVGEFSAGKSSFINALMREEALESGAVQGTTRLPVVIRYGEVNTLYLQDESGKAVSGDLTKSGEPRQEIIRRLNSQSAEGEKRRILLYSNSDFFKKGVSVVDTPGTNSLDEWHELVTKQSVSELADGCIILTPATHPMSESLCDFISSKLPFSVRNCIFVVSKIDMIPPEEREKQLEYVKVRIKGRLGAEDPLVLPYSSEHIMNGGSEKEASLATEEKIREFLSENRMIVRRAAQLSKLSKAGGELLEELERIRGGMSITSTASENFSEASLSEFTKKWLTYCSEGFAYKAVKEKEKLFGLLDECRSSEEAALNKVIDGFDRPEQLRNVFSGTEKLLSDIRGKLDGVFNAALDKTDNIADETANEFESSFSETFGNYRPIAEAKPKKPSRPSPSGGGKVDPELVRLIHTDISKTEKKIKHCAPFRIFLGAGTGMEIILVLAFFLTIAGGESDGFMILIPLCFFTVFGAAIGAISFAITHGRKRKKRMRGLRERISRLFFCIKEAYFRGVYSELNEKAERYAADMRDALVLFIDDYITKYRKDIGNIDRAKAAAARNAVFAVENDIAALKNEIKDMERLAEMFGSV